MSDVFIIAEVGSVHDGSFGNAGKLIDLAADLGASCIKFQTHIAAAETTRNAPMPPYFKGEPRFEYFERTGFRLEQWSLLKAKADERGLEFLSSPFSVEAVELLERIGVSRYKIPSGEVTNIPMLEVVAQTGKPVLLSSGMSDWREMDRAVETILKRHDKLTPMQCTSAYPTANDRVGLNVLGEMQARWGMPVGYSDHTLDNHAIFAAVALGAVAVEKHLTFSRAMYGSDAPHSAEPPQFADLVKGVRAISEMLASRVEKNDLDPYRSMKQIFEKSVVARVDIAAGATITAEMVTVKKPGDGIPAARLGDVIGRRARGPIAADTLLRPDDMEPALPG
ncbi:N-acetylneuraminate synthase [Alsobacter metallidurans]|uniref:N-acetylneuraminate synthase n=1 Tax=Alsobacter metallidurans TaxID=340221 RepID=A0A917MJ57_9HYPH|nr:N-acetylneuraminate synthase family protein [Alsobacter metallidurans]GGH15483.1 N-acetylneuraminate synthase [Alsobacter metallidurans]